MTSTPKYIFHYTIYYLGSVSSPRRRRRCGSGEGPEPAGQRATTPEPDNPKEWSPRGGPEGSLKICQAFVGKDSCVKTMLPEAVLEHFLTTLRQFLEELRQHVLKFLDFVRHSALPSDPCHQDQPRNLGIRVPLPSEIRKLKLG